MADSKADKKGTESPKEKEALAPVKGEQKVMTPAIPGNQQPAKGTPASVLQMYQATNPLANQSWTMANRFKSFFNDLQVSELTVVDIVAINQVQGGGPEGSEAVPFALLQSWGITESDYIYIHLKFSNGQFMQVGAAVALCKSVGNDNLGNPNYYQMAINLIQASPTKFGQGFTPEAVPSLLFNVASVKNAANDFVAKALSGV